MSYYKQHVKRNSLYVGDSHHGNGRVAAVLTRMPTLDTDFCKISYVDSLPIAYTETDIIPDKIQYYIARVNSKLNLHVQLSNIKGCDYTGSLIGNIPTNYLNKKHRVYLLFIKNGSTYSMRIVG